MLAAYYLFVSSSSKKLHICFINGFAFPGGMPNCSFRDINDVNASEATRPGQFSYLKAGCFIATSVSHPIRSPPLASSFLAAKAYGPSAVFARRPYSTTSNLEFHFCRRDNGGDQDGRGCPSPRRHARGVDGARSGRLLLPRLLQSLRQRPGEKRGLRQHVRPGLRCAHHPPRRHRRLQVGSRGEMMAIARRGEFSPIKLPLSLFVYVSCVLTVAILIDD